MNLTQTLILNRTESILTSTLFTNYTPTRLRLCSCCLSFLPPLILNSTHNKL
uniref:Uncharacterized protein n=1 Tax=Arundo donax TaxID=35708 RepID=A0A0A9HK44_ARUDO